MLKGVPFFELTTSTKTNLFSSGSLQVAILQFALYVQIRMIKMPVSYCHCLVIYKQTCKLFRQFRAESFLAYLRLHPKYSSVAIQKTSQIKTCILIFHLTNFFVKMVQFISLKNTKKEQPLTTPKVIDTMYF